MCSLVVFLMIVTGAICITIVLATVCMGFLAYWFDLEQSLFKAIKKAFKKF